MTSLLESLAGLRAKEFAAEAKTPQELKARGLDNPEYTVALSLPASSQEIVFSFHKAEDKTYATTSQSTKIIVPEADILFDLERKPADLRESKVAVFGSWQADQLVLKKGALAVTVHKAANDKWYFDAAEKEEADGSKVDTFLRKIEGLEAAEYHRRPQGPGRIRPGQARRRDRRPDQGHGGREAGREDGPPRRSARSTPRRSRPSSRTPASPGWSRSMPRSWTSSPRRKRIGRRRRPPRRRRNKRPQNETRRPILKKKPERSITASWTTVMTPPVQPPGRLNRLYVVCSQSTYSSK